MSAVIAMSAVIVDRCMTHRRTEGRRCGVRRVERIQIVVAAGDIEPEIHFGADERERRKRLTARTAGHIRARFYECCWDIWIRIRWDFPH